MFAKIFTSALFAGFLAGLMAALLQLVFVQPTLLHAELYESGQLLHFGATDPVTAHVEGEGIDLVRDGLSVLFTTLIYTGYAFIMVAAMAYASDRGARITARTGMLWGVAGFVAVHLAPAFSLPPELPGSAATEVSVRQVWWFGTVAASALAMWLIGFGRGWAAWGAGIVLLLVPHLIGAPHPDAFTGPVPPELAAMFASRALGVGFAAWVLLGMASGYFWQGENDELIVERAA